MQKLITRSISAIIYALIFTTATLYSEISFSILVYLFTAICLWEFNKIIHLKGFISYALVFLIILLQKAFGTKNSLFILLIISILCSVRLIINLYSKQNKYPKTYIEKLDLTIRYIAIPFIFLTLLPVIDNNYNPYLVICIIILVWTHDSFAFLIGKRFGKTKLFERVSPKKTVEGFVGGTAFTLITGGVISYYSNTFTTINWIVIAVIISVFGTLGDLVESKFKRQAKVKDSGKLIPGHGGLLDRLDSLLFLTPFVYLYIHFLI
ncbi:MAG: phosphatidate cytidylyltransferase [Tenacibaculum sp.]